MKTGKLVIGILSIVLFLLTLAFNIVASRIAEKHRMAGSSGL